MTVDRKILGARHTVTVLQKRRPFADGASGRRGTAPDPERKKLNRALWLEGDAASLARLKPDDGSPDTMTDVDPAEARLGLPCAAFSPKCFGDHVAEHL